jgi:hypothetical protein
VSAAVSASTTRGSNCVPLPSRSSAIGASCGSASRYERSLVIAFRFTPVGAGAAYQLDDVYLDPWKGT